MNRHKWIATGFALLAALAPLQSTMTANAEPAALGLHATAVLKRSVVVNDEIVRIGDLIENAGAAAEMPIFRAPELGTTGSVSTAKILDAIRPHHLFRVDVGDIRAVEVTRAGRTIRANEIEQAILQAFAGEQGLGAPEHLTMTLDHEPRTLIVEPGATGELQVAQSQYDARTARFSITLDLPGSVVAHRAGLHFSGTIVERVEVLVLGRSLQRGDIIKASDLVTERRQKTETPIDGLSPGDIAAGMAARRSVRVGQVLRRGDLMKPDLIKRDDNVTLVYRVPGILLTTRGKALESGAEGETVSAVNMQSKRTVQGVVTGPGEITLLATTSRVLTASLSHEQTQSAQGTPTRAK